MCERETFVEEEVEEEVGGDEEGLLNNIPCRSRRFIKNKPQISLTAQR